MGANVGGGNTGKKNYYSVSYGKLQSSVKDVPMDYTEITEADLKAKTQAVEQIDLRKRYINKGSGEYSFRVFYDSITGTILNHEKQTNEHGTSLNFSILDTDGEISVVQMKMYSKYAENMLNRLLNTDTTKELTFSPYAIPNSSEFNGEKKSFYTQGVSIKRGGEKVEVKYLDKTKDAATSLPDTEQVSFQGKTSTSRDKRLDFLYEEFSKVFVPTDVEKTLTTENQGQEKANVSSAKPDNKVSVPTTPLDDLPFA